MLWQWFIPKLIQTQDWKTHFLASSSYSIFSEWLKSRTSGAKPGRWLTRGLALSRRPRVRWATESCSRSTNGLRRLDVADLVSAAGEDFTFADYREGETKAWSCTFEFSVWLITIPILLRKKKRRGGLVLPLWWAPCLGRAADKLYRSFLTTNSLSQNRITSTNIDDWTFQNYLKRKSSWRFHLHTGSCDATFISFEGSTTVKQLSFL